MNSYRGLKGNINKNYIYTFLSNLNMTRGIWMLYLAYRGLSLFEIGIMESIFHLTSFTMEVPTGIVADVFGRKTSRILSSLMSIISIVLMIFSGNIYGFAISFVFSALSYNLESGAGDALLYDSMKELNDEKRYMKVKGNNEVLFQFASSLSLPIGGYLATLNYDYVYRLGLIIAIITLIHSLSFIEPSIGKVQRKKSIRETFISQIKDSFQTVIKSKQLMFLIILTESFGVFATTEFFYIQNFLKMSGKSEFRIGIILAIGSLIAAIGAYFSHKIEKRFGYKKTLIVLLTFSIGFFWAVFSGRYSELGIIGLSFIEAIEFVVMSDYINRLIPSEQRATILSFQSMLFSLFMIIIFPIVGFVGDLKGLQTSFLMIAILSSIISMFMIFKLVKDKGQ